MLGEEDVALAEALRRIVGPNDEWDQAVFEEVAGEWRERGAAGRPQASHVVDDRPLHLQHSELLCELLNLWSGQPRLRHPRDYALLPDRTEWEDYTRLGDTPGARVRAGEWRPRQTAPYHEEEGEEAPLLGFISIPIRAGGDEHAHARDTWLSWARDDPRVEYRLFADPPNMTDPKMVRWVTTQRAYGDIVYVDTHCHEIPGCEMTSHQPYSVPAARLHMEGNLLGRRMIRWAMDHFHFTHWIRTDTDAFLCVHRLLADLATRPRTLYAAGSMHCVWLNRIDEAFLVLSRDLARYYVNTVGIVVRTMDHREAFENQLARSLLQTYVRYNCNLNTYINYPTYCKYSEKGNCFDVFPEFADFATDKEANVTDAVRRHAHEWPDFCRNYIIVHPIKAIPILREIFSRVELPAEDAYDIPPMAGINCSTVESTGELVRPGHVEDVRFNDIARSWWGDNEEVDPVYR
jgi:hypothetical protein